VKAGNPQLSQDTIIVKLKDGARSDLYKDVTGLKESREVEINVQYRNVLY